MANHRYLTWDDRLQLEALYKHGVSKRDIAAYLGCCLKTVYNELQRGSVNLLNGDTYEFYQSYSADIAQQKHDYAQTSKGCDLALGNRHEYCETVRHYIVDLKYSPDITVNLLRRAGEWTVSTTTLYRYIDADLIAGVTNKDLQEKRVKRNYNKVRRSSRNHAGKSIEQRPPEISTRRTVGHWEFDSIIGKAEGTNESVLTMLERKSHLTLLRKPKAKTAAETVRILHGVYRKYHIETITVDNGAEFSDCQGMENDSKGKHRLDMYYCHAYCSTERASNERMNRMIRRWLPKGQSLARVTPKDLARIENWLNDYPRRSLGYRTPREVYEEGLAEIL